MKDIYVIDHQTTDGSTDNLNVNVIPVKHDIVFDHGWLLDTVHLKQVQLLEEYQCVLFAEVDELIYSTEKPLNLVIDDFLASNAPSIRCVAYELVQDYDHEKALTEDDDMFEYRNQWFRHELYDKSLITKVPLQYCLGFHTVKEHSDYGFNVFLIHLHRLDFEMMLKRNTERLANQAVEEGRGGLQNKTINRNDLFAYFNETNRRDLIPAEHKLALKP